MFAIDVHGSTSNNNIISKISEVKRSDFNLIADRIKEIYEPIIRTKGGNLVINSYWDSNATKAYTRRVEDNWELHLFGGLARYKTMTKTAYALVLCHELGHQLGGLPKKTTWLHKKTWTAAEGQADYYATAKCMKRYLLQDDNIKEVESMNIYPEVVTQCQNSYIDDNEIAICIRSAMAGETLVRIFAELNNDKKPSILTSSSKVVKETNFLGYPSYQCRVDTFFQGALCNIPFSIEPNESDINEGYCARINSYEIGTRPLCWYKPTI